MHVTDEALQLRVAIMERASVDTDFRARLLTDAKAALKDDMGLVLSDEAQVSVVEETPMHVTLVLPNCTDDESVEVSGFEFGKLGPIQGMCLFARNVGNITERKPDFQQPVPGLEIHNTAT